MQVNMKAGDVLPVLKATLKDAAGAPLDLTQATSVNLRVRQLGSSSPVKWSKPCVVVTPAQGAVEYRWTSGDTTTPGTYEAEFVLTWPDGGVQTVPNSGQNATIQIRPTLA